MLVGIDYGRSHIDLDIPDDAVIGTRRRPLSTPIADVAAATTAALESPMGFPALSRALTPDDHVGIVIEEQLPRVAELLVPVLKHVVQAHVRPERVTAVFQSEEESSHWRENMPVTLKGVQAEVHDPGDRKKLSYLATTRRGRRIYLNRTVVDADQVVVLARRRFHPVLGYSGAEGAIFPAVSDRATRQELYGHMSLVPPGDKPWPARREAGEVAWLLGVPFVIEMIEGFGDDVSNIVAGTMEIADEAIHLLNANWRVPTESLGDVVVAALSGAGHTFADLATALANAARVVKPQGRIILLTEASPSLGAASELLRQAQDPDEALKLLRQDIDPDLAAAYQWASAAKRADLYLFSQLPAEATEEMFATPLQNIGQVQRLLDSPGTRVFLTDAHKTMALAPQVDQD